VINNFLGGAYGPRYPFRVAPSTIFSMNKCLHAQALHYYRCRAVHKIQSYFPRWKWNVIKRAPCMNAASSVPLRVNSCRRDLKPGPRNV